MAFVTSVIRVAGWLLCLFCARGLAQFEDLLGDDDASGSIGNITLIPPQYYYAQTYGDIMANVTCDAKCSACQYQWMRDRDSAIVSNTQTVNIGQLGLWNAGNYTCTVTAAGNETATISFAVSVKDTRRITDMQHNSTGILLVPIYSVIPVVTASATCTPVPCTFSWLKNGRVIRKNNVLDLGNMTYSEAGQYYARASVAIGQDTPVISEIALDITYTNCIAAPCAINMRLNPPNTTYEARFGGLISTVECMADCYPFCDFVWRRLSDGTVVSRDATIRLTNLTRDDFAQYQCFASATSGKSNITITSSRIEILYSGTTNVSQMAISTNKTTLVTALGNPIQNVTCTAQCSPFDCEFTWTNVVTGDSRSSASLNELIPGMMKYEYIGYFECNARVTHVWKGQSETRTIIVTDIDCEKACSKNTRLVPPKHEYSLPIGGSAPSPILCQADCNPPCFFEWKNPSSKVISHSETLVLKNLKDSDFGTYQCFAHTNDSVVSKYSLTIIRPDTSDAPNVGVIVGSVVGGVAAIALIVGVIVFVLHRKKSPDDNYKLLLIKDKSELL